jgi:hypothetical protein
MKEGPGSGYKSYHLLITLDNRYAELLDRIIEETGKNVEDLTEATLEQTILDYAKIKGWIA